MDQEIWGIYRTAGHRREVREIQRNEAAAQRSFSPEILTAAGCVSMQSQIRFGYSVQRLSGWHRISRLHQDKAILSPAEACPTALCTTTPRKQFGKTFMIWQYSELVSNLVGKLLDVFVRAHDHSFELPHKEKKLYRLDRLFDFREHTAS